MSAPGLSIVSIVKDLRDLISICVSGTGIWFCSTSGFCLVDMGKQWTMDFNIRGIYL